MDRNNVSSSTLIYGFKVMSTKISAICFMVINRFRIASKILESSQMIDTI